MKTNCPNKSHPDFKKLVEEFGELDATYAYFLNGEDIPSFGQVINLTEDKEVKKKAVAAHLKEKFPVLYKNIEVVDSLDNNSSELLAQDKLLVKFNITDPFAKDYLSKFSLPKKESEIKSAEQMYELANSIYNPNLDDFKYVTENENEKEFAHSINVNRINRIKEWTKFIDNSEFIRNNPFMKLFIFNSITKGVGLKKETYSEMSPVLNKPILESLLKKYIELNKVPSYKNFIKEYSDTLRTYTFSTFEKFEQTESKSWIYIPSKSEDSENFKQNIEKLQVMSYDGSRGGTQWCTSNYMASTYLQEGGFYLLIEKKSDKKTLDSFDTKIAVRTSDEGNIKEVQGINNNGKISASYHDDINELANSKSQIDIIREKTIRDVLIDFSENVNMKYEEIIDSLDNIDIKWLTENNYSVEKNASNEERNRLFDFVNSYNNVEDAIFFTRVKEYLNKNDTLKELFEKMTSIGNNDYDIIPDGLMYFYDTLTLTNIDSFSSYFHSCVANMLELYLVKNDFSNEKIKGIITLLKYYSNDSVFYKNLISKFLNINSFENSNYKQVFEETKILDIDLTAEKILSLLENKKELIKTYQESEKSNELSADFIKIALFENIKIDDNLKITLNIDSLKKEDYDYLKVLDYNILFDKTFFEIDFDGKNVLNHNERFKEFYEKIHPGKYEEHFDNFYKGENYSKTNDNKTKGSFNPATGNVKLSSSAVQNVEDVERTFLHEVIGHRGVETLLQDKELEEYQNILLSFENIAKQSSLASLKRAGYESVEELAQGYFFDTKTKEGRVGLVKELIARIAEDENMSKQSWFGELLTKLKEFLNKVFNLKMTSNDLKTFLSRARIAAEKVEYKGNKNLTNDSLKSKDNIPSVEVAGKLLGKVKSKPIAIWGMATTGKTFLAEKQPDKYIDFDTYLKPVKKEIKQLYRENKVAEAEALIISQWKNAIEKAKSEGKQLLGSQQALLSSEEDVIDEIYYNDNYDDFKNKILNRDDDESISEEDIRNRFNSNIDRVNKYSGKANKNASIKYLSESLENKNLKPVDNPQRTSFESPRLTSLQSLLTDLNSKAGITSSPANNLLVDGLINEQYILNNEVSIAELAPLFYDTITSIKANREKLMSTVEEGFDKMSYADKLDYLANNQSLPLKDFLTNEAIKILNSKNIKADEFTMLFEINGKHNDIQYYSTQETIEEEPYYSSSKVDTGNIAYNDQSDAQKKISKKIIDVAKIITGNTVTISTQELLDRARSKKDRKFLEEVVKGSKTVTVYERTMDEKTGATIVTRRPSMEQKFISNRNKTASEIEKQEDKSEVYRNTGTALHKMKEDAVKNLFSTLDVNDAFNKNITSKSGSLDKDNISERELDKLANTLMAQLKKTKQWNNEIHKVLNANVFADKYMYRAKNGVVRQAVQPEDKQHDAQYEKLVKSLLKNYLAIYKIQRKKDIETAKKSGKPIIINKPNIITERIVFDEAKDEAGTMDFVAIFSDGDAAIIDYKFMKAKFKSTLDDQTNEVVHYLHTEDLMETFFRSKERAYNMQLSRYSEILTKLYGVKKIIQVRIKPSYINYTRNTETGEIDENSKIIELFTSEESIGMMPIREEKTGNIALDRFLDAIIDQSQNLIDDLDKRKAWYTDFETVSRVNELKKIIVSIQVKGDLSLYTQYVTDFVRTSTNAISNNLESFDMAKINNLNHELEFIKYFLNNTSSIMKEYSEQHPTQYQKFNEGLGKILTDINVLTETIGSVSVLKLKEESTKLGMDENVFESFRTAADISGIQSYLMGMKSVNHPLVQIFSRNVERLNAERIYKQSKLTDDLKVKTDALDKWASSRGLSGTNKFKIMLNDQKNLLTEYGQEYYELRRKHDDISSEENVKWWRDNFEMSNEIGLNGKSDVTAFQEAKKRYFDSLEASYANAEDQDKAFAIVNSFKEKWLIKNDFNRPDFDGFANCRFMTPKNKERFYSDKYKELSKAENKPAKDYYEFLIKKNYEFREEVGYDFQIDRNLVPNIHKSMIDTISQDGGNMSGIFKNYWNSFANEFRNKEDGKVGNDKKEIPILFIDSIRTEDKSIDLGKNLMMFATFINQYKHAKELKEVGNVIKRVILETPLAKQKFGNKVVSTTNAQEFVSDSSANSNLIRALEDYFNYYVYGETTKKDAITETIGETGVRLIGKIQKLTGRSAMAFNFLSAMAGSVNARSQTKSFAAAGKYFTEKQVREANLAVTKFDPKLAFLDAFFQTGTQGTTDAKASALSANKLVRSLSEDPAYIFQRWFDKADEKVILHAMLSNFGIDPNTGNIERLDKLKRNYPSIEFKSILESVSETELPDGTKNFDIINQHTGKPIEPDYGSEDKSLLNVNINTFTSVRRKTDEMISRIKGAMSDENIATYRLSLLGRALGQYRNWIPTTFGERLKAEGYNMTMDEYEIGRWRVAGRIVLSGWSNASRTFLKMLVPFANKDFSNLSENPKMRQLYDLFIENNPSLREKVSYEDYIEEHAGKLRSLAREIQMFAAFFISLLLLKWAIDDDEEKFFLYAALINSLERVNMELGFYLPMPATPGWDEFMKLLTKDPLPVMTAFNNVTGLIGNTIGETIDTLAGVESGKTIAPKMSGSDWDFSFTEKKDPQGKLHYLSNYAGLGNVAKYAGLRDNNNKKDSVWDYVFGESGETNKQ